MALQMRFLQALTEVASENNSTIVFPLPLDLLRPFLNGHDGTPRARAPQQGAPGTLSRDPQEGVRPDRSLPGRG
jgi:hypothetical protein